MYKVTCPAFLKLQFACTLHDFKFIDPMSLSQQSLAVLSANVTAEL